MTETGLTASDLRILRVLQAEGRIANVDLAGRVGFSPRPACAAPNNSRPAASSGAMSDC